MYSMTVGNQADAPVRIVFLHGLFGQGRNFSTIAKALLPEATSELIDLPNHGRSAWTDEVGYLAIADLVADHLRQRPADQLPVHVVGHSMGGKVAMVLALRHPDLVDRLVVVDISPVASDDMGQFEYLLGALASLELDSIERRAQAEASLSEKIRNVGVRSFLLQNLRRDGDVWRWQANLELLRAELGELGSFPDLESTFDHPVLWIAGEHSDYVRPEYSEAMRALFPKVVKVSLKGAGHWVHSEQPERFIATLRSFLF